MSEVAINAFGPITTADTPDVDLHVENGTITDGNGNAVAIGDVYDETERARGKENAAVTTVADGTPTGTLQTDGNGNVAVEGHGTVTLVGDRRRVTTVGGTNRNAATLKTDADGNVFGEYLDTFSYKEVAVRNKNSTFGISNQSDIAIDLGERTLEQPDGNGDYSWFGAEVQIVFNETSTGETFDIDGQGDVDGEVAQFENGIPPTFDLETKGKTERIAPFKIALDDYTPSPTSEYLFTAGNPSTTDDETIFSGEAVDNGNITIKELRLVVFYSVDQFATPSVSLFDP